MESFYAGMKMAELVEANYRLLGVTGRMGIDSGFGEHTVDEVCAKHSLDTDTFLLLCNVYSFDGYTPTADILRHGHVTDILLYLHKSHDYYLQDALVKMTDMIERLVQPCAAHQKKVINTFLEDYRKELDSHFEFEEGKVIPYVQSLLIGRRDPRFSIAEFEDCHSNIDEKLSDLKNLIMKSLPRECDSSLRVELLLFIFALQEDLSRHIKIEDEILVPMVRLIENPRAPIGTAEAGEAAEADKTDGLSEREKEILVSVASGMLNKEIADKHNISINTVITHRKNITRKTGIRTVAGLTVYAILNNLIDINTLE